jgi:hypothetical protein
MTLSPPVKLRIGDAVGPILAVAAKMPKISVDGWLSKVCSVKKVLSAVIGAHASALLTEAVASRKTARQGVILLFVFMIFPII